ncbi:MAG: hypothetical protein L6Q59_07190 [Ignavibacteriaceae bacterium]|nr:hypothetical protein [Ignavibacteriaceae bacterium]
MLASPKERQSVKNAVKTDKEQRYLFRWLKPTAIDGRKTRKKEFRIQEGANNPET